MSLTCRIADPWPLESKRLCPQSETSKLHPRYKNYTDLRPKVPTRRATLVWALHTCWIPLARGAVCLAALVDVASNRVLAHNAAITLGARHDWVMVAQALAANMCKALVNEANAMRFGSGLHIYIKISWRTINHPQMDVIR